MLLLLHQAPTPPPSCRGPEGAPLHALHRRAVHEQHERHPSHLQHPQVPQRHAPCLRHLWGVCVCVCVFGVTGWARAEEQGAMAQWRCGSSTAVGWGQRGSTSPPCDGQATSRVPSGQPARLAGLPLLLAQPTPPYLPAIHQQRPLPGVGQGEGAARVKRQVGLRMSASVGVSTPAPAQAASGSEPCVHSHGEHPARLAARTPRACHLSTGPACCPPLHPSRSGAHRVRSSPAWCASGASAAGAHQGSHSPHCACCGSKRSGFEPGSARPTTTHAPAAG